MFGESMESATSSKFRDTTRKESIEIDYIHSMDISEALLSDDNEESASSPHGKMKKIVLKFNLGSQTQREKVMKALSALQGIRSIVYNTKDERLLVVGDVDRADVIARVKNIEGVYIIIVEPVKEPTEKLETGGGPANESAKDHGHKLVLGFNLHSQTLREKVMTALSGLQGIQSIDFDTEEGRLTVIGDVDHADFFRRMRKIEGVHLIGLQPTFDRRKKHATGSLPQDTRTCSVL